MPDALWTPRDATELIALRRRVADLEAALQYARDVAEQERRRAHHAEESAARAWTLAGWGGAR